MQNTLLFARKGLGRLYEAAIAKIFNELQLARRDANYATVAGRKTLSKKAQVILDEFRKDAVELFKECAYSEKDLTERRIVGEAETLGVHIKSESFDGNESLVEESIEAFDESILLQTRRMMMTLRKVIRKDIFTVMRYVYEGDVTRKKASELALPAMLDNIPSYFFTDRSGKRWKTDFYFDTLILSLLNYLELDIVINIIVRSGYDLIKVTKKGKDPVILSISNDEKHLPLEEAHTIFHPRSSAIPHFWREQYAI